MKIACFGAECWMTFLKTPNGKFTKYRIESSQNTENGVDIGSVPVKIRLKGDGL